MTAGDLIDKWREVFKQILIDRAALSNETFTETEGLATLIKDALLLEMNDPPKDSPPLSE